MSSMAFPLVGNGQVGVGVKRVSDVLAENNVVEELG